MLLLCFKQNEDSLHLPSQDGTSKMSKSAELDISRINMLDSPETIQNKVKRAKTDLFEGLEYDNPERPEAQNLLTIYQLMTGHSRVCYLSLSPSAQCCSIYINVHKF